MSRARATYLETLVPFPIGVMLNSASMAPARPGGLIRLGAVRGPVAVDCAGLAATYDRARSRETEVREFWVPSVLRLGGITAGTRGLDVGGGTGRLAVPLSEGHPVVGVDVSREMLAVARGKTSRPGFVLGDASRPPFGSGTFRAAVPGVVL